MNKNLLFFLRHGIAIIIPIALMWILYHSVLQAWWLADDPALLQSIAEHGIISHFYQSEVWRSLSSANLTPWVILSLGIDWHFFGLDPLGYYWHHLLSFSIVLLIAYFVLNRFFSPLVSSLTLSFFVASIPSANIAQFLMTRHYLEGLGLSLLAILLYVKAIETHRLRWAIFGSIFYLLATTAKEIYVPLVVVLLWFPVGNWQQRWKMLIPFIAVAGSYVLWRAYMLKPSYILTGYSSLAPKLDWNIMLTLPNRVVEVLGWQHSWQLLIMLLAALIYLFILLKYLKNIQWFQLSAILIWLAVTFLPIVPVLSILDSRYLFLPYFIFCLSVAFSLQFLIKQQKYITLALGLSLLVVGLKSITYGPATIRQIEYLKQSHIEGNLILTDKNSNGLLVNPIGADWYYQSLQWLRKHILKLPKGVEICYDLCLCQYQPTDKIYQYMQGEIITSYSYKDIRVCSNKTNVPLSVKFRNANDTSYWQLAPYQHGQYYIAISQTENMLTAQWLQVPVQGSYPYKLSSKKLYLVIKYISPEGWYTYSPTLVLDPAKTDLQGNVELIWER